MIKVLMMMIAAASLPLGARAELHFYDGIAAIVDSEVITFSEMHQRLLLLAASLGVDAEQEGIADQLRPELINAIISEKLRLKRAKLSGIGVDEEEIAAAIAAIESRNNIKPGGFIAAISARGGAPELAKQQIKNQLIWEKYVDLNLRPRIVLSEEEVEERVKALSRLIGKSEYRYSEIFIPKDNNPNAAAEFVEQLADTINGIESERRRALIFSQIARQYSRTASAAGGGEVGWHVGALMDSQKHQALKGTTVGALSEVVETSGGFYLMLLHQTRIIGRQAEDRVTLKRFAADLPPSQIVESIKNAAAPGCEAEIEELKVTEFADVAIPHLSATLRQAVEAIDGKVGEVFVSEERVYALCEYRVAETIEPDRDEVANKMVAERLDKVVQKTIRSLMRNAYIDVRI